MQTPILAQSLALSAAGRERAQGMPRSLDASRSSVQTSRLHA